jgi:triosephosphate isomerase
MVIGNWKMNGGLNSLEKFCKELNAALINHDKFEMIVCPPLTLLASARVWLKEDVKLGAQNVSHISEAKGAFTGEISANMISELGCKYIIIGHSERRIYNKESNELIRQKVANAHMAGMTAILCVGDTKEERANGKHLETISKQIIESLPESANYSNTVIAYEPVWAIGTGKRPRHNKHKICTQ